MKKWFQWFTTFVFVMIVVLFALSAISCTRVNPGMVGIKVNMAGSDRGVDKLPLVTGWVMYFPPTTKIFEYPTYMQTAVWTSSRHEGRPVDESISFSDKDQMLITADINLSYYLIPTSVPAFYVQFRSDDLNTFTHGYLRNVARDAFNAVCSHYAFDEINGSAKERILAEVKQKINDDVSKWGVKIEQFGFIGGLRPPPGIALAINDKIAAVQNAIRTENELRQSKAEAQKVIAKATGEAEANRVLAASISPQLIQWRTLQITQDAVARWNGQRPTVEGLNSGGLLLNINPNNK